MQVKLSDEELIERGRQVIEFRRSGDVALSEDFLSGYEEGVAELIGNLTGEAAADMLEMLTEPEETPPEPVRPRSHRVGCLIVHGTDEKANVSRAGTVLEEFENATTTDTSEPSAFRRAIRWAEEQQR